MSNEIIHKVPGLVEVSYRADWERNTLAQFGDRVEAMLSGDPTEIRTFFGT